MRTPIQQRLLRYLHSADNKIRLNSLHFDLCSFSCVLWPCNPANSPDKPSEDQPKLAAAWKISMGQVRLAALKAAL